MIGKFVFGVLVALFVAQGLEAYVAEPRSIIDDAIKEIKVIVEKIKEVIEEITGKIPGLVSQLKEKIDKLVSEITQGIKDIPKKIQEQIEKVLTNLGIDPESVPECFAVEKEEVKKLTDKAIASADLCRKGALDNISELVQELHELRIKANKLLTDSAVNIVKCMKELHIPKVLECLKEHHEELKADAENVLQQVKITNQKLADVPVEMTKCLHNVNLDAIEDQKKVIENFKECAKNKQE